MNSTLIGQPGAGLVAADGMQRLIDRCNIPAARRRGDRENIATGPCGIILLLMEYYRQCGDHASLLLADKLLLETVAYCRQHTTVNYALYTGRGGVVYTLLQRQRLGVGDRSDGWIVDALELIGPANKEFLHSAYVTDDLYNGRAGTLLLLLHLYLETRQPFLTTYIEEFALSILEHAYGGREGMYWPAGEEMSIRPPAGMALGATGIQYVFSQLAMATGNKACAYISAEAGRYAQTAWVPDYGNWGNFSRRITTSEAWQQCLDEYEIRGTQMFNGVIDYGWAEGTAGMLLAGTDDSVIFSSGTEAMVQAWHSLSEKGNWSLYNGAAGLALCMIEKACFPEGELPSVIVDGMSRSLANAQSEEAFEGGLLHGDAGSLYILMRHSGAWGIKDSILTPFQHTLTDKPVMDDLQGITMPVVRKIMLSRQFPRTVSFLQAKSPLAWKKYLDETKDGDHQQVMAAFHRLVTERSFLKGSPAVHACMNDVYQLEGSICLWQAQDRRSPLQQYLDDWQRQKVVLGQLGWPDEWLLEQTLTLSSGVTQLSSAWNWSFADDFGTIDDRMLLNIQQQAGRFEYLLQSDGRGGMTMSLLRHDTRLLKDCFAGPLRVSEALEYIRQSLGVLSADELQGLLATVSEFTDTADYFRQLNSTVLYAIRQWLYRGILQFHI